MTDEQTIANLDPDFAEKVKALKLKLLELTGYEWFVAQGRRTIADQNALYAHGRNDDQPIVTKAKGGQSAHNFGLAVDMVPLSMEGQSRLTMDWDAKDSMFKQYADIAQSMGFVAGYYFRSIHDPDHVEDSSWKQIQAEWLAGKINIA